MTRRSNPVAASTALTVALTAAMTINGSAAAGDYEFAFQLQYGDPATFNVGGPATGDSPNVEGDAFLNSVVYPNGDEFIFYYMPSGVSRIQYDGDAASWVVRGGLETTTGVQGDLAYSDATDEEFAAQALLALRNTNLNNYVDLGSGGGDFEFTIEFEIEIKDNDEGPDEFGEILYFERGTGDGNSWFKMQAVDADGTSLGPWLVIKPSETVQTSPQTTVWRIDQKVGTASIDVSRLGVTEVQYIKVSNDVAGEAAYDGGGDFNPDFKLMAVMTDMSELARTVLYD